MKTWLAGLLAGLLGIAIGALAPVAGLAATLPDPVCHETPEYLVIGRGRDGETGNDIIVRAKPGQADPSASKPKCVYAVRSGDYRLGQGLSADFLTMRGRFLALDEGTGPDRRLLIYDIAARKKLVDAPYVEGDIAAPTSDGFTFWQVDARATKPAACPASWRKANKEARSAHLTNEVLLRFDDGLARRTGRKSCTATQDDM